MDSTIIASIVGGIATICAAIIPLLVKSRNEKRLFYPISRDRRKALTGKWEGIVVQQTNTENKLSFKVQLDIEIKGRKLIGNGTLINDTIYNVELEGSFRNDRFLKMDYRNKEPQVIQFGSFIFHLSDDARGLKGLFVGYGHLSKSILHGHCEFHKN